MSLKIINCVFFLKKETLTNTKKYSNFEIWHFLTPFGQVYFKNRKQKDIEEIC